MKDIQRIKKITWQEVLQGYSLGIFPMGETTNTIAWYEANPRAILPIAMPMDKLHITRSLSQTLRKNIYKIKYDTAFGEVITNCAELRKQNTWINKPIINVYTELFERGYAHSVEAWKDEKLTGGLYGVAYMGAFFGESMFHLENDASKVAVVSLYETLKKNNFILFDIQMMTPVFSTFRAVNISKEEYLELLKKAMNVKRKFVPVKK